MASVLTLILIGTFANVSSGSAITGNIPVPVIGTAAGFYAGNEYPVIATTAVVKVEAGETALNVSLLAYLLPNNAIVGSQCTGQGTLLNSKTVVA
ncbi:MAG: hypothetical protein ACKOMW_06550, partial [Actinomycetes bacterium]